MKGFDRVRLPNPCAEGRPARWGGAIAIIGSVLPFAALLVEAATRTWTEPLFAADMAAIELGVRELLAGERSLGMYSRFGWAHPGPALFALLAPWYALLSQQSYSLVVGGVALHAVCVAAAVGIVRRRFGVATALASALVIGLLLAITDPSIFSRPWPPYQVATLLVLYLAIAAAFADGSGIAGGWAALVGSVAVQVHLGVLPVVLGVGGVALLLHFSGTVKRERRAARRSAAHSLVVLVLLGAVWAPPLYEQVTLDAVASKGGNLSKVRDSLLRNRGSEQRLGIIGALDLIDRSFGSWGSLERTRTADASSGERRPPTIAILVALLGVALWALLVRRRWRAARAVALALAATICSIVAAAAIIGGGHAYVVTFVFAVVLFAVVSLVVAGAELARALPMPVLRSPRSAIPAFAIVALVAALTTFRAHLLVRWTSSARDLPTFVDEILDARGDRCVRLEFRGIAWPSAVGALLELQKRGIEVIAGDELAGVVGRRYRRPRAECANFLFVPRATSRAAWGCEGARFRIRVRRTALVSCDSLAP